MDKRGQWWQNIVIGVRVIICGLLARALIVVETLVSIGRVASRGVQNTDMDSFLSNRWLFSIYEAQHPGKSTSHP